MTVDILNSNWRRQQAKKTFLPMTSLLMLRIGMDFLCIFTLLQTILVTKPVLGFWMLLRCKILDLDWRWSTCTGWEEPCEYSSNLAIHK
jgi:hypothetical protein